MRRIAMISVHGCPMVTPGMHHAGGMNVYLRDIAPAISAKGVCVDVFTRSHHAGGPETFDFGPHARVIHLAAGDPDFAKAEVVPYLPDYQERLLRLVEDEDLRYDLVHSHYWLSGGVGKALADQLGVPHVVSYHTLAAVKERESGEAEPDVRKEAEERIARDADLFFAFTPGERQDLNTLYGIPADRVHVAPGAVDLSLFGPRNKAAARKRLGVSPTDRIVLFVGRPEPFKGPDVLIKALAGLPDDVRLLVVGGSESEYGWLRLLAASQGVTDRVSWHAAVPQPDLIDYYAASDLCALPSYHESFGLVALEAMACGRPVVASAVGGLRVQVIDGETGRLVPSHDPQDFARCIGDLLAAPHLMERMGRAGIDHAETYTWEAAADQALDGYRYVLDRAPRTAIVTPCG